MTHRFTIDSGAPAAEAEQAVMDSVIKATALCGMSHTEAQQQLAIARTMIRDASVERHQKRISIRYRRVSESKRAVEIDGTVVGHLTEISTGMFRADAELKKWLRGYKSAGPSLFPSKDAVRQAVNIRVREIAGDDYRKEQQS